MGGVYENLKMFIEQIRSEFKEDCICTAFVYNLADDTLLLG